MASYRPQVSVFSAKSDNLGSATGRQVTLPSVFVTSIRPDVIQLVHNAIARNKRQPYAVAESAGMQHSAESWGTGRAVARIPRVSGSGTHRAGQAAFGNMCRKGRMFAPTKTWRKWHQRVSVQQRRYALTSAIAATAIPALVMARGHRVENVNEIPLIVSDEIQSVKKTSAALKVLKAIHADDDIKRVAESRKLRAGKGKMRNRRFVQRRGPLVIYENDESIVKAFRNVPGIDFASVERLNLLQLAPGGHVGRFVIWTESAVKRLDSLYGTHTSASTEKKGFHLPRSVVTNPDISRIINSDEVQSVIRPVQAKKKHAPLKKNPLKNLNAMLKLNPYFNVVRRAAQEATAKRASKVAAKRS